MKHLPIMKIIHRFSTRINGSRRNEQAALIKQNNSVLHQNMVALTDLDKSNQIITMIFNNRIQEMRLWSEYLQSLTELSQKVAGSMQVIGPAHPFSKYLVGSLFLYDAFERLNRGPEEHLFFVSGLTAGGMMTLDHICEFKVESASRCHARGEIGSSHLSLINLDNKGYRLHALFHKHPGTGAGATFPSSTDMHTQERMERGGYPAIGAIFSEDGYIRFFSARRQFTINIYGKGVDHVQDNTYHLTELR
jgi:hypothetical protein